MIKDAELKVMKPAIKKVLAGLNPREQKILIMRFGLEDAIPHTLAEIAKEFNLIPERIRQIEAKALRKLRLPSRSRQLRENIE